MKARTVSREDWWGYLSRRFLAPYSVIIHMARWIQNINPNDFDVLGDTIIAGWWPFTFYRVMTWKINAQDSFVTVVQKTDRNGFAKSEDTQFETGYPDKTSAREGHSRIVAAVAQGKRSSADLLRYLRR
jgi:hypothetical protein